MTFQQRSLVSGIALLWLCLTSCVNSQFQGEYDLESRDMARNLETTFSWSDPELEAMLWEGQQMMPPKGSVGKALNKRADEPPWWDLKDENGNPLVNTNGEPVDKSGRRFFGPAYPFKCILCQDKRTDDPTLSMSMFTSDKMVERMKDPVRWDLSCIFYTQRPVLKVPLIPFSLSQPATQYACRNNMRSIWMLWPYNPQSCGEENYYCNYEACCWMAPLLGTGTAREQQLKRLQYFGYMSAAMATTCRGRVWIMTDDLKNVPYDMRDAPLGDQAVGTGWLGRPIDKSIWLKDELPMLRELFKLGLVSDIWTIDIDGNPGQQVNYILERTQKSKKRNNEPLPQPAYNMTALIEGSEVERRKWFALPESARDKIVRKDDEDRLMKRDSCTGAIAYQPFTEDWFG